MEEAAPTGADPAVVGFYDRYTEEHRLEQGPFQLEEARTRELIQRFAPPPPGTVLDVGGAGGAYALWLAATGYTVHLVDLVPRLVGEAARRSAAARRPLASCRQGDARALDQADATADIVLLLGPLYHLTEGGDRARALREAARVLKPGGWLFAAAISRWGSTLDGLARDLFRDPRFARMVDGALRDGVHRNATDRLDYFTTSYFHRPEELGAEVRAAGLSLQDVYGIEGPGWILPDIADRLADEHRRAVVLGVARLVETEPAMVGSSAHLLAVARRPS
jgi:SAM-dependent methyltransferase